jgi:hypothetical protein
MLTRINSLSSLVENVGILTMGLPAEAQAVKFFAATLFKTTLT